MSDKLKIWIPDPLWWSNLANIILDLERLRSQELYGEVPPYIFFQLKDIFQILETLWSARIEGNNTTLAEYIEKIIEETVDQDESQQEVKNLEDAISWIEENTKKATKITRAYISELHKIVTKWLTPPLKWRKWEWSHYPWELRPINVQIQKSAHIPPDYTVLSDYFEEFLIFLNTNFAEQYQLLMVAIAHHRFAYIHPFDNGNWRMWRLLNYALLIRLWFQVKNGRIINPSSVFYSDRDVYYKNLWIADSLLDKDLLYWSEYFLSWLKNEMQKIDSLLSRNYVHNEILLPALELSLDRKHITDKEFGILKYLISKDDMSMKAEELDKLGVSSSVQKSRTIAKLREKKILRPIKDNGRIYTISFINNYLLRSIVKVLEKKWFVSEFLNKNP